MIEPNTEDLMIPPKLSQEQDEISAALTKALGTENYTLKYPVSGDYRSAFVLTNLDSEADDEAVAFYLLAGDSSVRMNVLDKTEKGSWESVHDTAGVGTEVYSVAFSPISVKDGVNIIVSWKEQGRATLNVQVYAYDSSALTSLFSGTANYVHFLDMKQDGYAQMLLLGWRSQNPVAQIVRRAGPKVVLRDDIMLSPLTIDFAGVTFGKTGDGRSAMFIDELIGADVCATEVITIDSSFKLRNLMEIKAPSPDELIEEKSLHSSTTRPAKIRCADLDNNGMVEIPTQHLLPGYRAGGEGESLYMTNYNTISKSNGLQSVYSAIINHEKGYYVKIPDSWIDNVTVKSIPESGIWQFVVYDTNLENSTTELLTIRVLSTQDYKDKFESGSYFLLAKRGIFEYHASIPVSEHPLGITKEQVLKMFSLL